jgi:hypothetical protein
MEFKMQTFIHEWYDGNKQYFEKFKEKQKKRHKTMFQDVVGILYKHPKYM